MSNKSTTPQPSASPTPGQPAPAIQQALFHAQQHHAAGRLGQAESLYQQILQTAPNQPDAIHLLGVIALQMGKYGAAAALITKALAIKPEFAEAHCNLGHALQSLGKQDDAVASFRKALAIKPEFVDAYIALGNALQELGMLDEAVANFRKTLSIAPDFAEVHNNLGNVLQELGNLDEAVASYRKALAIKPQYVAAHNNLGVALKLLGKLGAAVASYRNAVALAPDYAEAHNNLGIALRALGKLDEAVASHTKALAIKADYAEAHSALGNSLQKLGKLAEAVASYRKAIAINAGYVEAHYNLGNVLKDLGNLDGAVASFHKALAIKPDYTEAHRDLAMVKKFTVYDDDIKAIEDAYAEPGLGDRQKMHLAFGLGKSFEDIRQYEKAFGFYQTGNALKRGTYDFSIEVVEKRFERLKELFTKDLFAKHQAAGSSDETPIFILGMLRSGTTLVEQIIASHPNVYGAGELMILNKIVTSRFRGIDDPAFAGLIDQANAGDFSSVGDEYIGAIRERAGSVAFVTDKMPYNFRLIGMIKLMLPKAKIIHCCRDARDTCLSIFKNELADDGNFYANDLRELGQYHNLYRDLMSHWHSALPGYVYDIHYEDMVADQEKQSRALLAFCGLGWDDACLEFYRTNRPVQTASAAQVRRPIYKDSVRSWKRYENQLAPLLDVLTQENVPSR